MKQTIEQLENDLVIVESQIKRLQPNDSYFDALSRSFHLGMVGGSGKNTYRLNKRREAAMDRSISTAKQLTELYTKRDNLSKQIDDIKSGKVEQREKTMHQRWIALAEYWKGLKVGDQVNIGNSNGNPVIAKKSRLSVLTTGGTKWTAQEVIGRNAAKYI